MEVSQGCISSLKGGGDGYERNSNNQTEFCYTVRICSAANTVLLRRRFSPLLNPVVT